MYIYIFTLHDWLICNHVFFLQDVTSNHTKMYMTLKYVDYLHVLIITNIIYMNLTSFFVRSIKVCHIHTIVVHRSIIIQTLTYIYI